MAQEQKRLEPRQPEPHWMDAYARLAQAMNERMCGK